ncbi:uncharacterized protein [Arachis hypogaea]|uniref:uncharacterized protein isoform X1 n=1 Tax=Arachis hypogaea TaxID=3818 RepID=UPI003B224166
MKGQCYEMKSERARGRERAGWGNTGRGRTRQSQQLGNDPRIWNCEQFFRLDQESFTVFVDRLPSDISKHQLFELFSWTGRINDVYLSRKMRNGFVYLFAFIRYTTKGGALKAISNMNHMRLRGNKIFVGEAKYKREMSKQKKAIDIEESRRNAVVGVADHGSAHGRGGDQVDGRGCASEDGGKRGDSSAQNRDPLVKMKSVDTVKDVIGIGGTKEVEVTAVPDNLAWLQKSIIGSTTTPINFRSLREKASVDWPHVVRVSDMGAYKAMLTFESVSSLEDTLAYGMNSFMQFFCSVSRWEMHVRCAERRVWLECIGLPVQVWTEDTFRMIGSQWGDVVCCDEDTKSLLSFRAGHILVDTYRFDAIHEKVRVLVGTQGFDVLVTEAGSNASRVARSGMTDVLPRNNDSLVGPGRSFGNNLGHIGVGRSHKQRLRSDAQADWLILAARGDDQQKGRLVIQPEDLNEWSNGFLVSKTVAARCTEINFTDETADHTGSPASNEEVNSEQTISWDYGRVCRGDRADLLKKATMGWEVTGPNSHQIRAEANLSLTMAKGVQLGQQLKGPQVGYAGMLVATRGLCGWRNGVWDWGSA